MKNNNQTNQLIKNDIFSKEFNSKILKDIIFIWKELQEWEKLYMLEKHY